MTVWQKAGQLKIYLPVCIYTEWRADRETECQYDSMADSRAAKEPALYKNALFPISDEFTYWTRVPCSAPTLPLAEWCSKWSTILADWGKCNFCTYFDTNVTNSHHTGWLMKRSISGAPNATVFLIKADCGKISAPTLSVGTFHLPMLKVVFHHYRVIFQCLNLWFHNMYLPE